MKESKELVIAMIEFYEGFIDATEYAERKIKEIIQWSWTSKDMGVIDEATHIEIYGRCIDALVFLEN